MLSWIKNLSDSFVAGIRDRTTDPLTVAFVVSWSLWNYQLLLVLWGNADTELKLGMIRRLYPWDWNTHVMAWLGPLMAAVLYVFAYPWIRLKVIMHAREKQVDLANTVKKIEKKSLLDEKDVAGMVSQHEKELEAERKAVQGYRIKYGEKSTALDKAEKDLDEARKKIAELQGTSQPSQGIDAKATHDALAQPKESPTQDQEQMQRLREKEDRALDDAYQWLNHLDGMEKRRVKKLLTELGDYAHPINAKDLARRTSDHASLALDSLRDLHTRRVVEIKRGTDDTEYWNLTEVGQRLVAKILRDEQRGQRPPTRLPGRI